MYKKNEIDTKLFFIIKGEVELFVESRDYKEENKILARVQKGNYVGHEGFLTNLPRDTAARSRNVSLFACIK